MFDDGGRTKIFFGDSKTNDSSVKHAWFLEMKRFITRTKCKRRMQKQLGKRFFHACIKTNSISFPENSFNLLQPKTITYDGIVGQGCVSVHLPVPVHYHSSLQPIQQVESATKTNTGLITQYLHFSITECDRKVRVSDSILCDFRILYLTELNLM